MPARRIESEIAVVGAGIAGLTAASTLAREGVDVVVLEARDRVGGRVWNTEIGGEANELGGQWVAPYQSAMHALLEELGIELFPSFREGEHVYIDPAGHGPPLRRVTTRRSARASERAFDEADAKLDALAKELDPEAPWDAPRRAPSSTRSPSRRGCGARSTTRWPATCCAPGSPAASWPSRPTRFSLLQGLWMIAGAGGTYELFEPDQCLAYRVVGGSQLIPIRLAERLGDRVVLDAPAREIRWSEDGVEIDAGGGRRVGRAPRSSRCRRT